MTSKYFVVSPFTGQLIRFQSESSKGVVVLRDLHGERELRSYRESVRFKEQDLADAVEGQDVDALGAQYEALGAQYDKLNSAAVEAIHAFYADDAGNETLRVLKQRAVNARDDISAQRYKHPYTRILNCIRDLELARKNLERAEVRWANAPVKTVKLSAHRGYELARKAYRGHLPMSPGVRANPSDVGSAYWLHPLPWPGGEKFAREQWAAQRTSKATEVKP